MLQIQNATPRPTSPHPILNLGFRIFFVGAAIFSVLSMVLWALILQGVAPFKNELNPFYWHAHEMVFGYGLAVVAGFLLTAVKTWTNQPMPYGVKLIPIFVAWAVARVVWLGLHAVPSMAMMVVAFVFDIIFWGLTTFFVIKAVWSVRQKRQLGIVLNLLMTWLCQLLFYVGVFGNHQALQKQAIYLGFYMIIVMIFIIGRRVLPFFIEKGVQVGADGKPNGVVYHQKNSEILDKLSIVALILFVVNEVFLGNWVATTLTALIVAVVNGIRLVNWYHVGIWHKSLLWSLYLSFWGLAIGFAVFATSPFMSVDKATGLAVHILALSGIGLTTLAMMCRVSLGHTGRNIHMPPKGVGAIFGLMGLALVFRVLMPMLLPSWYLIWVGIAQGAWVLAFGLFLILYGKILASPRTDGLFG